MRIKSVIGTALATLAFASTPSLADNSMADAEIRADETVKAMTAAEKTLLTHGPMAIPLAGPLNLPADGVPSAGYIPGIPRLGVPASTETDASLGVAYVMGLRKDGATALPSAVAQAASVVERIHALALPILEAIQITNISG